jgi:hypothetical protein
MSQKNPYRAIHLILSIGFFMAAIYGGLIYLGNKFDLIPDSLGPFGYLDDVILMITLLAIGYAFYRRAKERIGQIKQKKPGFKIMDIIFSKDFWFVLAIIGLTGAYVYYSFTLFPDKGILLGAFDKYIAAIIALVALIRHKWGT